MHIAIEQQNIAQLGCAFNADRELIDKKYAFRSLPCQAACRVITDYFKTRLRLSSQSKRSFTTSWLMLS